ncbi:unnamed protein product, partial [marine sediment metagenome]
MALVVNLDSCRVEDYIKIHESFVIGKIDGHVDIV